MADLVLRVKESRFVVIAGPSGSGKSSLVRAGLIHTLKQGTLPGSERWLYESLKPGRNPIEELARVASSLAGSLNAGKDVREQGLTDATILHQWADIALKDARDRRAVIFVDQFEEAFTQVAKESERVAFLNLLTHAATVENGRVTVLFAMRSDFVSNCATYPQLNALLNRQFLQIGAMEPDELVSAIALPALQVGLRIDPDLIAQIVNDMQDEPGALPLMQFALKDLFDAQQAKGGVIALTLEEYLARGGLRKSLERHADAAFAKLSEAEQRIARDVFTGLIQIGRGTQDTRRTALFSELIPAGVNVASVEAVAQKLADARLITTDVPQTSEVLKTSEVSPRTVTIAHEKLIEAWPWLHRLVNENRDAIALQNQIAEGAQEWECYKRDPSYLYVGARLATAREQLAARKIVLGRLAQAFIEAGIRAEIDELEEAKRQAARLRRRAVYLAGALAVALVTGMAAVLFALQSNQQRQLALARQLAAQAQQIVDRQPEQLPRAVLLAVESLHRSETSEGFESLGSSLDLLPHEVARMAHDGSVSAVAFSPDGQSVVSGSGDGTARVWEAATGREVARMAHDDWVYAVAFSPDGQWVVSASVDGTARVWEAATGRQVARMAHEGVVFDVAFSPDGQSVVSGGGDGTARVRLWRAADLIELACSRLPRNLPHAEWERYLPGEPYRKTCENLPEGE